MFKKLLVVVLTVTCAPANAESVPGNLATKNGFKTCQKTVDGIGTFLTKNGNDHGALATWNKNNADNRLFNSLVAIKYKDGYSAAVIDVANTKANKCDGSYTTVFYSDQSCSAARETSFKEWKYSTEMAGLVILENKDGSLSKLLLPAGTGCVTVTTEVIYQ